MADHGSTGLSDEYRGLSDAEANARLLTDGPNELPRAGTRTFLTILRDILREPMLVLLLAAGAFYGWATVTTQGILEQTFTAHEATFPVPFPLTEAELEGLRHARQRELQANGVDLTGVVTADGSPPDLLADVDVKHSAPLAHSALPSVLAAPRIELPDKKSAAVLVSTTLAPSMMPTTRLVAAEVVVATARVPTSAS